MNAYSRQQACYWKQKQTDIEDVKTVIRERLRKKQVIKRREKRKIPVARKRFTIAMTSLQFDIDQSYLGSSKNDEETNK